MDVKTALTRALLVSVLFTSFTACAKKSTEDSGFNKTGVDCAGNSVAGEKIVHWKNGKFTVEKIGGGAMMAAAFAAKNAGDIDYMEDNFIIHAFKNEKVGKTLSQRDWGGGDTWGVDFTRASELWNQNIYGDGVTVAIIDSGLDTHHSQLSMQLYTNPHEVLNGIDDDGNGLIDDINGYDFTSMSGNLEDTSGHGTHVAGIIAANHETGSIKGMAPHAKLLVYDFFTADGEGTVGDAIRAIGLAADQGAKVINASWGGPSCSRSLNQVIDSLSAKNVLFVSAAGNESLDIDFDPTYPAAYVAYNHITVAAMTVDEYTAGFSNYGDKVQLAAPGVNILSTYPGDSQEVESGTSMAAPFVTGAVALLWSAFPDASAQDIKKAITTAIHEGPYPVKSRGALDVAAAYEYLKARQKKVRRRTFTSSPWGRCLETRRLSLRSS
jgi:subtilisin family serine protease